MELPVEFKEKYLKLLGEKEGQEFLDSITEENTRGFRINTLKANHDKVSYDLSKPVPFTKSGYYGQVRGSDIEWISGLAYSQDPAAMFPATVANVQPGEKVLDLCAAPGGKSTQLAQDLANQGVLVANEISKQRVKNLRENLEKWGVTNVTVTNENPDRLEKNFKEFFDVIVVDAPCSGEGMFRKDPDAIKYWSQDYVLTCQSRQEEILKSAVEMLAPGGRLVYSTCTFSPEEDEQIVEWLVDEYGFKVLPIKRTDKMDAGRPEWTKNGLGDVDKTARLWFQDNIGEGQFAALLKKPGEAGSVSVKPKKKKYKKRSAGRLQRVNKKDLPLVEKVLKNLNLPESLADWQDHALISNDHVFVPAIDPSQLDGLHILSNGVELGMMKKNRFEPSQQLAQVLGQVAQDYVVDLDEDEFRKYLHGEAVKVGESRGMQGFILVSYQSHIFSFGKLGGDLILKNYYPKGLRQW